MLRLFIFLVTVSFVNNLRADAEETGRITRLQVEGSTLIMVWLDGPDDKSECSGGDRWTIHTNDALLNEKLSMLMKAEATNKQIKLRHIPGWGCGTWDTNKIYSVRTIQ